MRSPASISSLAQSSSSPSEVTPDSCPAVLAANTSTQGLAEGSWLDLRTEQLVFLVHSLVLIPLLFVLGAPLNVLNMAVFSRQGLADRIRVCLFSLALLDLLYLLLVFLFNAARAYWRLKEGQWTDAALRLAVESRLLGLYGVSYGSFVLSALIATERCLCVFFPLTARRCLPTPALVTAIVTAVVTLTALRFLVLAKLRVVCLHVQETGGRQWALSVTAFYLRNKALIDHLDSTFFGFVVIVGSSAVVLVTTLITAVKLQLTVRWRQQTSSALTTKELRVIKMILCLSLEFLLLSMPKVVLRFSPLISAELTPVGVHRHVYNVLVSLTELTSCLNSSLNFFVYYFNSCKYRDTLHSLLP